MLKTNFHIYFFSFIHVNWPLCFSKTSFGKGKGSNSEPYDYDFSINYIGIEMDGFTPKRINKD